MDRRSSKQTAGLLVKRLLFVRWGKQRILGRPHWDPSTLRVREREGVTGAKERVLAKFQVTRHPLGSDVGSNLIQLDANWVES